MTSYKLAKYLIQHGSTAVNADKLGVLLIGGSITQEQYEELIAMLNAA